MDRTKATFRNPLNPGPDPWLGWFDGKYYLAPSQGDCVRLWSATSLADLATAKPLLIWGDGIDVWAPEFYLLPGPNGRRWYCYFTKSDGPDVSHRMFCVESETDSIEGPYGNLRQLKTDPEDAFYAIDGSVLVHPNGKNYFLWAGHPGHVIYICEMETPWSLKGERRVIEASGFGCEEVREGPFVIAHGERLFLTYSACDTGKPCYQVGALWTTLDRDPLNSQSWTQIAEPILARADANGVFGPGHHSFFKSPDGTEDWICYHGKTTAEYTYAGRTTRAQRIAWTRDGMPVLTIPFSLETDVLLPSGDPGPASK